MECARCATPVPDSAKFCHTCGSAVSGPDGATAAIDSSELQQMESLLRADTQAEFTIERLLGRGGMAAVYLANNPGKTPAQIHTAIWNYATNAVVTLVPPGTPNKLLHNSVPSVAFTP